MTMRRSVLAALLAVALLGRPAHAAVITWNGTGTDWNTAANWSVDPSGNQVPTSSDTAVLGNTVLANKPQIGSTGSGSVYGLQFGTTSAAGAGWTITAASGGPRTLTIDAGGIYSYATSGTNTIGSATAANNVNIALAADQSWTVAAGGTLDVKGVVSGAYNLTKAGSGTLVLSSTAANTFGTGKTFAISAGKVSFTNGNQLGSAAISMGAGAILAESSGGTSVVDVSNAISLDAAGSAIQGSQYLAIGNGRRFNVNGQISGGKLIIRSADTSTPGGWSSGMGNVVLNRNDNLYTGGTEVQINGELVLAYGGNVLGSGSLTLDNRSHVLATDNISVANSVYLSSDCPTVNVGAVFESTYTNKAMTFGGLNVPSAGGSIEGNGTALTTFSGASSIAGNLSFATYTGYAAGASTGGRPVTFTGGAATITNGPTITQGMASGLLTFSGGLTLNSNLTLAGSGAGGITISTGNVTPSGAARTLTVNYSGTKTFSAPIDLSSQSLSLSGSQSYTWSGNLTGNHDLLKAGANTVTLSAANAAFTGGVIVNAGTVKIDGGAGGALPTGTVLTVNGSGVFNYDNTTASGALTPSFTNLLGGSGNVTSTRTAAQDVTLTFSALTARAAGDTRNYTVTGGTLGTNNAITLAGQADGFIDQGTFYGGSNYAWYDSSYAIDSVRGINYGTDAGSATSGATTSLASTLYQRTTGAISAQQSANFTTLNLYANGTTGNFALASGATVRFDGLLKSGGSSTTATVISGGTGLKTNTAGADMVIRVDTTNDKLEIRTPVLVNGASGLTKVGAGTLDMYSSQYAYPLANTYTGPTVINGGTLLVPPFGNGGTTSPLGASSNAASNLVINGGTLASFGGTGSNRLFTIGLAGATLDNTSGGSFMVFTNTGTLGMMGSGPRTLTLARGGNGTVNFSPQIVDGGGPTTVVFTGGGGAWALANNNTYSGGTLITGGVGNGTVPGTYLAVGSSTALGTGPITLSYGALGNVTGAPVTLANNNPQIWGSVIGFHGSSAAATLDMGTGPVTLQATASVNMDGADWIIRGVISGPYGITRYVAANSAYLTLYGLNTYTGATVMHQGPIKINTMADGGQPSSVGASSNAASNLVIGDSDWTAGASLIYVGSGSTTNRLFTATGTTAGSGTLESSGTGPLVFTNTGDLVTNSGATLTLSGTNTDNNTLSPRITSGALTKSGTGTWILNAANTYGGTTAISGGTLRINGSLSSSTATVTVSGTSSSVYGTLGGTGTIGRPVAINAFGHLAPGASAGTLTINNTLTANASSVFDFELTGNASDNTYDRIIGVTNITYAGTLNVSWLTTPATGAGTYTLISASGTKTGNFTTVSVPTAPDGYRWHDFGANDYFDESTGQIILEASALPADLSMSTPVGADLRLLINGKGTVGASVSNAAGALDLNYTLTATGSNSASFAVTPAPSALTGGDTRAHTAVTSFNAAGTYSVAFYGENTANAGDNATVTVSGIVVGTCDTTTTSFDPAKKLIGNVVASDDLAGLASEVDANNRATLLFGTAADTQEVGMNWRLHTADEHSNDLLVSDVVQLTLDVTKLADGKYVLEMSYNEGDEWISGNELNLAKVGRIFIAWDNSGWMNAGTNLVGVGVVGNDNMTMNWSQLGGSTNVGDWGVDTDANTVWVVLNHAGDFAVVPEPATVAFLALGGLSMIGAAIRRRRVA